MSAKVGDDSHEIAVLSFHEAVAVDVISSGYSTTTIYELQRREHESRVTWELTARELPHHFTKRYDNGDLKSMIESYADTTRTEDISFLAARRNGAVAGMLAYQRLQWNDSLWLLDIRVREQERRSGAGTSLVRALQFSCGLRGYRGISVETQINNYPAIQFYLRQGFQIVGFNETLYTNDDLRDQDVACFLFWRAGQ